MRALMSSAPNSTPRSPNKRMGLRMDDTRNDRSAVTAVTVVIGQDRVGRQLRQDLLAAMAGEPHDLVIDLRQVVHLPSTGLAALVGVQARQRSRLKSLTLVCGERSATEMALTGSGMKGEFKIVTEIPPR